MFVNIIFHVERLARLLRHPRQLYAVEPHGVDEDSVTADAEVAAGGVESAAADRQPLVVETGDAVVASADVAVFDEHAVAGMEVESVMAATDANIFDAEVL